MAPDVFLTFAAASAVLLAMPGPNVSLIVGTSVSHGTRHGLVTVLGTSSAMVLQLAVTGLGMATLMAVLAGWFTWLRWLGVAYLVYLGVQTWRAPVSDHRDEAQVRLTLGTAYLRGLLVSLMNPKTLLFYSAFLPQFLPTGNSAHGDLLLLSVTFLGLAIVMDGTWALLAGRARGFLRTRRDLQQKVSGGLLIGAGAGLALARRP